jgi:hypothetical protein
MRIIKFCDQPISLTRGESFLLFDRQGKAGACGMRAADSLKSEKILVYVI